MAIYTRTGDKGTTALFTGQRVSKTHPRVETYGTLDELNAALSLCRCAVESPSAAACWKPSSYKYSGLVPNSPAKVNNLQRNNRVSVPER